MRVISYNVNGLRAAIRKGLIDYLAKEQFDIVCFQEVKALEEQLDLNLFADLGYHIDWKAAEKKGYSGVATLSKEKPKQSYNNIFSKDFDSEGRMIKSVFDDFILFNCYFPSGTSGDIRQAFKMRFLDEMFDFIQHELKEQENIIVLGDYNICHRAIDIHDPIRNKNTSGFKPEERAWMDKWFSAGFTDSFRTIHPEAKDRYSWWSLRSASRARNKGWRIDYIATSENLAGRIKDADIFADVVHSDHCPIYMELS